MGRTENAEIFKDTVNRIKREPILSNAISYSQENQKILLETDCLDGTSNKLRFNEDAEVVVSKKRSFEAASFYKGQKICVHNFASATTPGGGVVGGSSAQEESLCRVSTLYGNLNSKDTWNKFYYPHRAEKNPIHNDDIIYTPNVYVFKTDTDYPTMMKEEDWYRVDVVTCAAPNLRERPSNMCNESDGEAIVVSNDQLLALHEKRLSRICDVAVSEGVDVLILGAFGCGAFCNNPEVVAKAARNTIEKYRRAFKVVEFAVYCHPSNTSNHEIFKETFAK